MKQAAEVKINKSKVKKVTLQAPKGESQAYVVQDCGSWRPLDIFLNEHSLTYIIETMYQVNTEPEAWNYFKYTYNTLEGFKKYLNPPPPKITLTIEDIQD